MEHPDLPILKEQLNQCNQEPLKEESDFDVECLLSEKELYRSYLKYFQSPVTTHTSTSTIPFPIGISSTHSRFFDSF